MFLHNGFVFNQFLEIQWNKRVFVVLHKSIVESTKNDTAFKFFRYVISSPLHVKKLEKPSPKTILNIVNTVCGRVGPIGDLRLDALTGTSTLYLSHECMIVLVCEPRFFPEPLGTVKRL